MNPWERQDRIIEDLQAARRAFATEDAADVWLRLHNPRLGGVPVDLIRAGYGAEVVREARRAAA